MKEGKIWGTIADLVLHILIGGLLLFLLLLIGAGAVLTSLLLLNPCTLSLGILLMSSSWGGALCMNMAHDEPYLFQAVTRGRPRSDTTRVFRITSMELG